MKITGEKFYFTENANELVFEFTFKSWRMEGLDTRGAGDDLLNNFLGLKEFEFIRNNKNEITLILTIEKDAKSYKGYIDINDAKDGIKQVLKNHIK